MNKGVLKKVSLIVLVLIILLTGKALATDARQEFDNKIEESTINSLINDKSLGYSAIFDTRNYQMLEVRNEGGTNANWAIIAAKLIQYMDPQRVERSAKHIDYATAAKSVEGGNENAHNRDLGTAGNMMVALGYLTSLRGPVAEGNLRWDGNFNVISKAKLNQEVTTYITGYRIFPSIYKKTYTTDTYKNLTIAINDKIIYNSENVINSSNVTDSVTKGSKFSATKDIKMYTAGEVEQIREEIKEHIVKTGPVAARIYRNDSYMSAMNSSESVSLEIDYDDDSWNSYYLSKDVTRSLVDMPSYYCKAGGKTPDHDVLIVGWDDTHWAYGAPEPGAYIVMDNTPYHAQIYKYLEGPYSSQADAAWNGRDYGFITCQANRKWWRVSGYWSGGHYYTYYYKRGYSEATPITKDYNYYYVSYSDYYIESQIYGITEMYGKGNANFPTPDNVYQHDILGMSTSIDTSIDLGVNSGVAYGANVFTRTTTTPEKLTAISVASETDMKYEVYVNPKNAKLSEENLIKVAETDFLKAGYNTIYLDTDVYLTGKKFAVAVKYIAPKSTVSYSVARIGVEAPKRKMYYAVSDSKTEVRYSDIELWKNADASKQQSYIGDDLNNWVDLNRAGATPDTKKANICIKAFTVSAPTYKIVSEDVKITYNNEIVTEPISVIKGDSIQLKAKVIPSDAADQKVTWSTNDKTIATVDRDGKVVTNAGGKVTIRAKVANTEVYSECTIDVRVPVTSFGLNKNNVTILAGEVNILAPIIGPDDATNTKVEWSSNNEKVVKVTDGGLLIGLKNGTAIVACTLKDENGLHTATCKVTVPEALVVDVTDVTLNKNKLELAAGSRETLIATVLPKDATNTAVVWTSSNKDVAIVNQNGRVTALAKGTATITATTVSGGEQATCEVTVKEQEKVKVIGISLNTTKANIQIGQEMQLVASVVPSYAENKNIIWTSDNWGVAEIDETGKIIGASEGTTYITATTEEGGYSAKCLVTVTKPVIKVEGVGLNRTNITINKDDSFTLTAKINPVDADNQNVTWTTSNNNVATINNQGIVTAVGYGTAIITVTTQDGGFYRKCLVTVPNATEPATVAVTGISLSNTSLNIEKGKTAKLAVTVNPSEATNKEYLVAIADTTIAEMTTDGVKGLKAGNTTITFTTVDGNKTATCNVTVTEPASGITIEILGSNGKNLGNPESNVMLEIVEEETASLGDPETTDDEDGEETQEETQNNIRISPDNEIYGINVNTSVSYLKKIIKTNGTITAVVDKDGNPLEDNSVVGTGTQITITVGEGENAITGTFTLIVNGDVNGDKLVSSADVDLVCKHLTNQELLNGIYAKAADVDEDEEITKHDLQKIIRIVTDELEAYNLPETFLIDIKPSRKSVALGDTIELTIDIPDSVECIIRVVEFKFNYDKTMFEQLIANNIESLNAWDVYYNSTSETILLTNTGVLEETEALKITLKAKEDTTATSGDVYVSNAVTTDEANYTDGTCEQLTIFVQEISSNKYNITENYQIRNVLPDTTIETFKQNLTGSQNATIKDKDGNAIAAGNKIGTGATVTTQSGETYTVIVKGDLDADGTIQVNDVVLIKLHIIGLELLEEPYLSAADMDNDGTVSISEVTSVKVHLIGLERIQ